jgi:hypothetical protein
MGCPYNSDVALDEQPSVKINTKLLGKWQERTSEDATYIVTQKDDYNYTITETHKPAQGDTAKPEEKVYTAFLSTIAGTTFLNLYQNDQDPKTYYFYKIEISDEIEAFTTYPVTEYITEKFTSPVDLKKYFTSYKDLSFFYETKTEYIKVGK